MLSLLLLPPLLRLASAQLFSGVPGSSADQSSFFNDSHFCNQSFADANATAIHSWGPQVGATDTNISYFGTVYQPADGQGYTELSLWFSPGDQNYTDDFRLGYDVYYLWLPQLTLDTLERGASDTGDCLQTLDQYCVNDLVSLTNTFSTELVGPPTSGPNSNLTTDSLPTGCNDLAEMLTQNFPNSCKVYFNNTIPAQVLGGLPSLGGRQFFSLSQMNGMAMLTTFPALTGPESLVSRSQCKSSNGYSLLWTQYGDNTYLNYVYANYIIAPILTAFMPTANAARPITLGFTKSFLACLRTNDLQPGSEPLLPLPSPTAVINPYADSANTSSSSSNLPTSAPA
ncbi:hypothetical protein EJ03DRAFT_382444 [Teratosphaeria nubilosa]|uniref:Uncharacterized protein n=1 Tax=Teratosphaeria nubilosa TaxID=161662 RepID=A0A6G1L9Y6_9PEZI|nr:hypothetical protein EJ03DRAFT_382444 [Teratosphaeria nubilosa]